MSSYKTAVFKVHLNSNLAMYYKAHLSIPAYRQFTYIMFYKAYLWIPAYRQFTYIMFYKAYLWIPAYRQFI